MAADLEDRLRDGLAGAAGRFPCPPDLWDRIERRVASERQRAGLVAAAAVLVAVAAAGGLAAWPGSGGTGEQRVAAVPDPAERGEPAGSTGPGDGWAASADERLGWAFEHPAGWTVQRYSDQCRIGAYGTVVTNLERPLHFHDLAQGCTTRWDLGGVPAGFVGVAMGHYVGGPYTAPGPGPDTAFPLSLASAPPPEVMDGEPPGVTVPVSLGGDGRYSVRVWLGAEATSEDRAAAERVVASIRPGEATAGAARERPFAVGHFQSLTVVEDVELLQRQAGVRVRTLTWATWDGGRRRAFTVSRRVGNPLDVRFSGADGRTTVQGHAAVVGREGASLSLSWLARPDVTLSVSSGDLSEAELRAVAETVRYRPEVDDLTPAR